MTNETDNLVVACQGRLAMGASACEIIEDLRASGCNILEAIKVVRLLFGVDLGKAKRMVATHPAWRVEAEAGDDLHRQAIDAVSRT